MIMFSIIIPIFQANEFLGNMINSLTYPPKNDYEIILVDDGSTDGSAELCDEICRKDKRIRVVHKQNDGVASARNVGISLANGKYIMFGDADDTFDEIYLDTIRDICKKKEYGLIEYGYRLVDMKCGVDISNVPTFEGEVSIASLRKRANKLIDDIGTNYVWNKVFVRAIIEKYNLRFKKMKIGEDAEFVYQYLGKLTGDIYFSTHVLYNYVQNDDSAVHKYCETRYKDEQMRMKAAKELLTVWGYSERQVCSVLKEQYKNIALCELYNVLTDDCPMTLREKRRYLAKICDNENIRNAIKTDLTHDMLTARVQLFLLKNRMFFFLIVILQAKRKFMSWKQTEVGYEGSF